MGLLNQIGMANPGLVFSMIDQENLRKRQVADMERWRQEQGLLAQRRWDEQAPYRQLQAQMVQNQLNDYRTPEQRRAAEIDAYRQQKQIDAQFRQPTPPQVVMLPDEYGNPRAYLLDKSNGFVRQIGVNGAPMVGGGAAQPPQATTVPEPQVQPQKPFVPTMDTSLPMPSLGQTSGGGLLSGSGLLPSGPKPSSGLLTGLLSNPVPQAQVQGTTPPMMGGTVNPSVAGGGQSMASKQPSASPRYTIGGAYSAAGEPINPPPLAKYGAPQDMRTPEGTIKSVQWDSLGRFYRVLGDATKPNADNKPLPFEQASKLAALKNAYQQIESIGNGLFTPAGEYKRGTAALSYVPGTPEAKYEKQAYQAVEAWLRAMSGAAVPESEVKRYMDAYMPRPWDDPAVARDKLSRMQAQYTETMSLMGKPMKPGTAGSQGGGILRYNPKTGRFE